MRRMAAAGAVSCLVSCQAPLRESGSAEVLTASVPSVEPAPPALAASSAPKAKLITPEIPASTDVAARLAEMDGLVVIVESEDGHVRGSGAVVSRRGDVLTAAHVVDDQSVRYRATLPSGKVVPFEVQARDPMRDVAAGKVDAEFPRWLERGPSPVVGQWAICVGFPGSSTDSTTRSTGIVVSTSTVFEPLIDANGSRRRTHFEGMPRLDCGIAPGMSGGPVVDLRGRLIGVVSGAGGTIAPLDDASEALRAVGMSKAPATETPLIARLPDGAIAPSKWKALEGAAPPATGGGSLVELELAGDKGLVLGTVVAPNRILTVARVARRSPGPTRWQVAAKVKDQPDAGCDEVVATAENLVLLSCSALRGTPLDIGPSASSRPSLGQRIMLVDESLKPRGFGFVTGVARRPGFVRSVGYWRACRMQLRRYEELYPPVKVGESFAHDAGNDFLEGTLVVDMAGRPVGIDVASFVPGVTFSVSFEEALTRFPQLRKTRLSGRELSDGGSRP